jgi:hypothetical protein
MRCRHWRRRVEGSFNTFRSRSTSRNKRRESKRSSNGVRALAVLLVIRGLGVPVERAHIFSTSVTPVVIAPLEVTVRLAPLTGRGMGRGHASPATTHRVGPYGLNRADSECSGNAVPHVVMCSESGQFRGATYGLVRNNGLNATNHVSERWLNSPPWNNTNTQDALHGGSRTAALNYNCSQTLLPLIACRWTRHSHYSSEVGS